MEVKYDRIGLNYNLTRRADPYLVGRFFDLLNPALEGTYLDIGCGTGNYTAALGKKGLKFIGIDPSREMLNKAGIKNDQMDWRIGTAEKTDLENESINGIIGMLTMHHWSDLDRGFTELGRVIKGNGRIVFFTSTPAQMKGYWLNHYFPRMLRDSISQMPSFDKVRAALEAAGISVLSTEKYFVQPDLQDQFLYCGKDQPNLYFKEEVRNGISSFSSLANQQEVEKGLSEIRKDIDNGKIHEVMRSFRNNEGDYLFIVAQKVNR